jgi:hypothetical protein
VSAYSQGVKRNSKLVGQSSAVVYLCLFFFLVILQHQLPIICCQSLHALLQAIVFPFYFNGIVSERRKWRRRLPSQILQVHFVRYSVEVTGSLADERALDVFQLACNPIDCLISQVFRFVTTPTGKDLNEPCADVFIFTPRQLAVGIKPGEQRIKRFLSQNPFLFHRISLVTNAFICQEPRLHKRVLYLE